MPLPPEASEAPAAPGHTPAPAGFAARLALFRKDGDANR
jgi:flagellar protein FliO/FliZ